MPNTVRLAFTMVNKTARAPCTWFYVLVAEAGEHK